jgi:rubrerythrin
MASDYHEKDYDDEVYEDDYYEEHYEEEELEDESDLLEEDEENKKIVDEKAADEVADEAADEDEDEVKAEAEVEAGGRSWDEEDQKKITVSYACDECDYRWDDVIIRKKDVIEEDEPDIICPMCGSMNVTLI